MTEIRRAAIQDAKTISSLGEITFKETFGYLFTDVQDLEAYCERTFSLRKIESSLGQASNLYWLAFVNEKVAGYAKLKLDSSSSFVNSKSVCQLQKIYVLKQFQSLKLGYGLQEHLLNKAKLMEYEDIWLSVWRGNQKAIQFYKRNMFNKVGEHTFTIGKEVFDFIAMARKC